MKPNSGGNNLPVITAFVIFFTALAQITYGQKLQISDSGYFEKPGLNVLVFSSQYNGMFYDEKTAGIEIIHHRWRSKVAEYAGTMGPDSKAHQPPDRPDRQQYNGDHVLPGI